MESFNISLYSTAAYEITVSEKALMGLELIFDYHLLNDFDWGVSETSHFLNIGFGVYYKSLF